MKKKIIRIYVKLQQVHRRATFKSLVDWHVLYCARRKTHDKRHVSFVSNVCHISLFGPLNLRGWLLVRCDNVSLSVSRTLVVSAPFFARALRESPRASRNPHTSSVLNATTQGGLSAVFVFPFFPVSFRSLARGGRWNDGSRKKSTEKGEKPVGEISREKIIRIFRVSQIKIRVRVRKIN